LTFLSGASADSAQVEHDQVETEFRKLQEKVRTLQQALIGLQDQNQALTLRYNSQKRAIPRTLLCPGCGQDYINIHPHAQQCVEERNFKVLYVQIVARKQTYAVPEVLHEFDKVYHHRSSYQWEPNTDPLNILRAKRLVPGSSSALGLVTEMGKTMPLLRNLYRQLETYFFPPLAPSQPNAADCYLLPAQPTSRKRKYGDTEFSRNADSHRGKRNVGTNCGRT
jgi:hypothetical protein